MKDGSLSIHPPLNATATRNSLHSLSVLFKLESTNNICNIAVRSKCIEFAGILATANGGRQKKLVKRPRWVGNTFSFSHQTEAELLLLLSLSLWLQWRGNCKLLHHLPVTVIDCFDSSAPNGRQHLYLLTGWKLLKTAENSINQPDNRGLPTLPPLSPLQTLTQACYIWAGEMWILLTLLTNQPRFQTDCGCTWAWQINE